MAAFGRIKRETRPSVPKNCRVSITLARSGRRRCSGRLSSIGTGQAEDMLRQERQDEIGRRSAQPDRGASRGLALHVIFLGETETAMRLDADIRRLARSVGRKHLRHIGLDAEIPVRIRRARPRPAPSARPRACWRRPARSETGCPNWRRSAGRRHSGPARQPVPERLAHVADEDGKPVRPLWAASSRAVVWARSSIRSECSVRLVQIF